MALNDVLELVNQNTAAVRTLDDRRDINAFARNVKVDLANVMTQLNTVYYVLASGLHANALELGLTGASIYTDATATAFGQSIYWNSADSSPNTIKQSFDAVVTQLTTLENAIQSSIDLDTLSANVAELASDSSVLTANVTQVAIDAFGPGYTLDGDAEANLAYPLIQYILAMGENFNGWPGMMGYTLDEGLPALTLAVNLSDVNIDTLIPITAVNGLVDRFTAVKTFTGMDSNSDSTPDYSGHATIGTVIADGDSLEVAIAKLAEVVDDAVTFAAIGGATTGSVMMTAGTLSVIKHNSTTTDPSIANDGTQGYGVGSLWRNSSSGTIWMCINTSTGAAVWDVAVGVTPDDVARVFGSDADCKLLYDTTLAEPAFVLFTDHVTATGDGAVTKNITICTGDVQADANWELGYPGSITIKPGDLVFNHAGATASHSAGNLYLKSGSALNITGTYAGDAGAVYIQSGESDYGSSGNIWIQPGNMAGGDRGSIHLDGAVRGSFIPTTVTSASPAIPTDEFVVFVNSSGGAVTLTLADGVDGQVIHLAMTVAGNAATLGSTYLNGTSLVLDAVGEGATLVFSSTTSKWSCIGTTGSYTA